MTEILIFGLASAAVYAVAASGLVVTYTTSGIFNFAHGAVAMVCAFVYWQLSSPDAWDLPVPVALVLTLFVFAPGLGFVIDKVLMRRLHDATPIIRLVVPIGLLVALIQIASVIWSPDEPRTLDPFFAGKTVEIGGVNVQYHQLVIMAVAVVVAIGLRLLLYNTRTGVAMRAVVDSRELASLNGVSPDRISGLAWALGCAMAGLAGVLIAPILALDQAQLTLLVINAYAAAMVGRLRSLPLTALGAVILGISRQAVDYYASDLPGWLDWVTVDTLPAIMLFVVLLVVPQDKATLFGRKDRSQVPRTRWPVVAASSVALVVGAFLLPDILEGLFRQQVANTTLVFAGYALALGIVALSLVPLTGYAGQINLAPLAFAGIGAAVMHRYGSDGNPLALVAVVVVCAVVGALVALPALRLKGLYLALATFAFAMFCEAIVFPRQDGFQQGTAAIGKLHLGGLEIRSQRANLVLLAVSFALLGMLVIALRKSAFGRRLQAMKDSPAACATLGLDLTALKLQVFAISAAIAGLGGALLGTWRGQVGVEQFSMLKGALPGLPLVLLAAVGGIASVAGVLLGAFLFAVLPLLGEYHSSLKNLMTVLPGLAGIGLASYPDGVLTQVSDQVRKARERVRTRKDPGEVTLFARLHAMLLPPPPAFAPEALPHGTSPSASELAAFDAELGFDWGRCHADPGST